MVPFPTHRLAWLGVLALLGLAIGHWLNQYLLFARTLEQLTLF